MLRAAMVAVLVLVPLVAAACGGSSKTKEKSKASPATGGGSAIDAITAAARKTAAAGTEQLSLDASGTAGGQNLAVTGTGAFDTTHHVGTLDVDFSDAGISTAIDAVLSGTDMYLKSPLFALVLPTGKSWLKLDLSKAAAAKGLSLNTLLAQDPAQTLTSLQSLRSATAVGSEVVDGIATTHYRARADAGSKPGTYDVWIGGDGYVHRLRSRIVSGTGTTSAAVTLTVDLSDFGRKVTVAVPPASQTVVSSGSLPGLGG
jgi:hypothetical protein